MTYELEGYDTETRDARYRLYTRSKREADRWARIPRLQFVGSGHGIVFGIRELEYGEKRKTERRPEHNSWPERHLAAMARWERLSPAQQRLLERFAEAQYGELWLHGSKLQTGRILEEQGLVESLSSLSTIRDYRITDAGRELVIMGAPPG
jgi:hypothetical protein